MGHVCTSTPSQYKSHEIAMINQGTWFPRTLTWPQNPTLRGPFLIKLNEMALKTKLVCPPQPVFRTLTWGWLKPYSPSSVCPAEAIFIVMSYFFPAL